MARPGRLDQLSIPLISRVTCYVVTSRLRDVTTWLRQVMTKQQWQQIKINLQYPFSLQLNSNENSIMVFCNVWHLHHITVTSQQSVGVSNHWHRIWIYKSLFRLPTKKKSKLCVTGIWWGKSMIGHVIRTMFLCYDVMISISWHMFHYFRKLK